MNSRLKKIKDVKKITTQQLSELMELPYRTVVNYERGDRKISAEFLDALVTKIKINANWFLTGQGEMFINEDANQKHDFSPTLAQALEDALSEIEEFELVEYLKEKTVAKIVEKLSMPKNLLSKAFNFLIYERPLIYLYMIFKDMGIYDKSISHKEWIIKSISELDLFSLKNILGPAFNSYSKNHMIKRVEDLTDEECRVLVENISQLQKHLENNISISSIAKKRFSF